MKVYLSNAFSLSMLPNNAFISKIEVIELTDEVAKKYLSLPFTSAIGHEPTAKFIEQLTGVAIPISRQSIKLQQDDLLIVFQLMQRLPEAKVLTAEEMKAIEHKWFLVKITDIIEKP